MPGTILTTSAATTDTTVSSPEALHDREREAFESTQAARDAIDDKDVAMPNLDVDSTLSAASAALPTLRGLREPFRTLPSSNLEQFDRIETYIWALLYAHMAYAVATRPPESLPAMAARAAKKRDLLNAEISVQVKRGAIDDKQLDQLRGGVSYRNIALDLLLLVFLLQQHWDVIGGRTMSTLEELTEAQVLGRALFDAVNGRERTSGEVIKATSDRSRAFMLLVRAYDEVRRAAVYLRWHEGDADTLVPSLYAGRGGRPAKKETTSNEPPSPVTPAAPVVGGASPAAPAPTKPVIPGQPGGSPFLR